MELTNDFEVAVPVERAWAVLTDVERIAPCMPGAQLQEVEGDEYRGVVKVKVGPITAQYKGMAHFTELDDANRKAVLRAEGRDTRGQGNANATITATLEGHDDTTAVRVITDLTVTGKVAQFGRGVMADVSAKLMGQFVSCLNEKVLASEESEQAATTGEIPEGNGNPSRSASATAGGGNSDHGNGAGTDAGTTRASSAGAATAAATTAAAEQSEATGISGEPSATPSTEELAGNGARRVDAPEAEPVDLVGTAGGAVAKRVIPVLAFLGVAGLIVARWVRRRQQ
jgi:carbon monoxide dehydrogenase subunit G